MSGDGRGADDDLTRRAWLLRLGEITTLAGFAGFAPDLAAAMSRMAPQAAAGLPPGLYEPSMEHLTHALATRDVSAVPRGAPLFFSPHELEVVRGVVAILLGNVDAEALSDTIGWLDLRLESDAGIRKAARSLDPLHRALAVAYYGKARVDELEAVDSQMTVRTGLDLLDQRSRVRFGRDFLELTGAASIDLVAEVSRMPPDSPLGRCYVFLRREAIRGYFTSRAGLKEIDYKGNAFYGVCPGCDSKRG